jgi:zinc protease
MWVPLALALPALATEPLAIEHRAFELENGLRVVLHAEPRAPVVSIQLLVALGARDDPPGQAGAAHLLEHVLFTGSLRLPGQGFDLALAELGGDANAWTHYDWTGFSTTVPPAALERALVLEADRIAAPAFDPEAVRVQRAVIRAEAAGLGGSPHGQDAAALVHLLFPDGHPYGRDLTGLIGPRGAVDLDDVDPATLRTLHEQGYAPSRCVLVVAGDLDLDRAEAWVRASYGAIPGRQPPPRAEPEPPPLQGEARRLLEADVGEAALYLGWRGVPAGHPDEPALAMLAWLLTEESRLQRRLVDTGRASRLQAWSDSWGLGGSFVVALRRDRGSLEPLRRAVDRELTRLARRGPDPARLERARGAWWNRWLRTADPVAGRAGLVAQCVATGHPPDCLAPELGRYLAVQPADIQRVARGLRDSPGRVLLSVVSPADRQRALPGSSPLETP